MSGTRPHTKAKTKCRSDCLEVGKTTRTLGPAAHEGQINGCKRRRPEKVASLGLENRALRSRAHEQRIAREHAFAVIRLRRGPAPHSRLDVDPFDRDPPALDVDVDDVAILER